MSTTLTTDPGTAVERAAALAEGLRNVAELLVDHPELTRQPGGDLRGLRVPVYVGLCTDVRQALTAFARAGLAAGATVTEDTDDYNAGVNVAFGPVTLRAYAPLDRVHEVTRQPIEYTPRPILTELTTTPQPGGQVSAA